MFLFVKNKNKRNAPRFITQTTLFSALLYLNMFEFFFSNSSWFEEMGGGGGGGVVFFFFLGAQRGVGFCLSMLGGEGGGGGGGVGVVQL